MGIFDRFKKQEPITPPVVETPKARQDAGLETFNMAIDYSLPIQESYRTPKGYLYGPNGLFPQELNRLYNQSPLHASILKLKTLLTSGCDYLLSDRPTDINQVILLNQLTNQFDNILNDVTMDYFLHSRVCLEVTWNKDFSKIIKLERISPDKVRILNVNHKMEPTDFIYSWDWTNTSKYIPKEYAAFDIMNKKDHVQIFQYQVSSPGMKLYAEVSYQSALNWVVLDSEMSQYHKSNILNSINPSLLIQYFEKPGTQEEKRAVLYDLNNSFAGARKTGRAMVTFSDGKELAPTITQMEANKLDKTFLSLTDTIQRQILYAHQTNPILLGLKTPGSLGGSTELQDAYKLFDASVIQPAQKDLEYIFNKFLSINGLGIKLKLKSPNIYEVVETSPDGKPIVEEAMESELSTEAPIVNDNVKNLTAKQHMQLLRILRQYSKGQITKAVAHTLLKTGLAMSDDDIEVMLSESEE